MTKNNNTYLNNFGVPTYTKQKIETELLKNNEDLMSGEYSLRVRRREVIIEGEIFNYHEKRFSEVKAFKLF